MPSTRVLQSCLPAAPLLIARLILICYMFSYAPAWVVFSRAFCFCALWALPGLCLSFRPTNSLILLQCFRATCLFPSFMPVPRAFTFFFRSVPELELFPVQLGDSPLVPGVSVAPQWGGFPWCLKLIVAAYSCVLEESERQNYPFAPYWSHVCSLLKQTAEIESTHFWQHRNDAGLANLAKLGQCIST